MATTARPLTIATATKGVNVEIQNRAIRQAVALESFKAGEVRATVKLLRETNKDLIANLDRRLKDIKTRGFDKSVASTKRLRQLIKSNDAIVKSGIRQLQERSVKSLQGLALTEAELHAAMVAKTLPIGIDYVTPPPALLKSVVTTKPFRGALLKDWYGGLSQSTQRSLTRELSVGIASGESNQAIARRMRGVLKTTRKQAMSITRTATSHVSNSARELTYIQNKDVIKGVQYVATLDRRTTDICISLDGEVYPVAQGPRPPTHHQCRSTTIPVVKGAAELGIKDAKTRASMNGQVPARQTYPQWLKKQPKSVQNEVLGKGKAELWRQGKFDISKPTFRPITLEQLQRRLAAQAPTRQVLPSGVGPVFETSIPIDPNYDSFRASFINRHKASSMAKKLKDASHLDERVRVLSSLDSGSTAEIEGEIARLQKKVVGLEQRLESANPRFLKANNPGFSTSDLQAMEFQHDIVFLLQDAVKAGDTIDVTNFSGILEAMGVSQRGIRTISSGAKLTLSPGSSLSSAQFAPIDAQISKIGKQIIKLRADSTNTPQIRAARKKLGDLIRTGKKSTKKHRLNRDAKVKQVEARADNFIRSLDDTVDKYDGVQYKTQKLRSGSRAYNLDDVVHVAPDSDVATVVHEIGHSIELQKPGARKAALDFLKHRISKAKGIRSKLTQDRSEVWGFDDAFDLAQEARLGHYTGKIYSSGDVSQLTSVSKLTLKSVNQTEIVSMGLELMYSNPATLAVKDPEFAKFILGILDGTLL